MSDIVCLLKIEIDIHYIRNIIIFKIAWIFSLYFDCIIQIVIHFKDFQSSDSFVYTNLSILAIRYSVTMAAVGVRLNCFSIIFNTLAVVENHPQGQLYRRESKGAIFIEYHTYYKQVVNCRYSYVFHILCY